MFIRFSLIYYLLLLIPFFCFSQNDRVYTVSNNEAVEMYKNKLHNKYEFLNGTQYKLYHVNLETSPLFDSSFGMEGTIYSNGETFPDLMLTYDIHKDELIYVTEIFENCNFISINRSLIDSFTVTRKTSNRIGNYRFKSDVLRFQNVDFPENSDFDLKDGFYEVERIGDKKLFIHHEAILEHNQGEEAIINGIFRYEYFQNRILFLNGNYYDINSKRKLVKLFPEHRKVINKKLGSFGLRFDHLTKQQLIETLQLTNPI